MPTIYDVIKELPYTVYPSSISGHPLLGVFSIRPIKTVIEVGKCFESSTLLLAEKLPDDGYVIAVDTWNGAEEEFNFDSKSDNQKREHLYHQFLANCVHKNIAHKVIPAGMNSLDAAKAIKIEPDLFCLAATNFGKNVYQDLTAWGPKLKKETIICGFGYNFKEAKIAVDRYAEEREFKVVSKDAFWIYE